MFITLRTNTVITLKKVLIYKHVIERVKGNFMMPLIKKEKN
jgi:hypothetical protein